jgi:hypothetical protein
MTIWRAAELAGDFEHLERAVEPDISLLRP